MGNLSESVKAEFASLNSKIASQHAEIDRLIKWVEDLQSGMYINCVYCGHRYGPAKTTPIAFADVLKRHIEVCPKHPMSVLKKENEELKKEIERLKGTVMCMDCGKIIRTVDQSKHLKECPKEKK